MNLLEAFVKLDEDAFDTTPKGIEDLSNFMDDADVVDDEIEIIDPDIDFGDDDTMPADDEESEEENAHVGQLVLQCNTCNALVYKDKDEVELDDEGNVEEEECPNCHNVSKFDVIGKICTVDDLEDELEGDEEESEEKEEDESEKPEEESEEEVEVDDEEEEEKPIKEESLRRPNKKSLKENRQKLNEGPGAGYTVSGDLTDIRINSFDFKVNGDEVIVNCDIDATLENARANSYYYGGFVGNDVPVKISQVSYYIIYGDDIDVEEDLKYLLDGLHCQAVVGGGWSHTTFDGELEVVDTRHYNGEDSDVFNVIMHCTNEDDIQDIDDLVTGRFEEDEEEFDESLRRPRKIREAFEIDDSIIKEAEDIVNNADLTMTSIEEDGDEGGYIEITDKNSGMNFWIEYWPSDGDWDMDWNQYIFYNNHEDKLRKAIQEDSDFASWAFDIVRDNLPMLVDESLKKSRKRKSCKESLRRPRKLKEAKERKLSNDEWNAISRLTLLNKLDDSFDIQYDDDHDFFYDFEEDEELTLEDGLELLQDALAYPLGYVGLSDKEAQDVVNVFRRFGIGDEKWYDWLLSKDVNESLRKPRRKSLKESNNKKKSSPKDKILKDIEKLKKESLKESISSDDIIDEIKSIVDNWGGIYIYDIVKKNNRIRFTAYGSDLDQGMVKHDIFDFLDKKGYSNIKTDYWFDNFDDDELTFFEISFNEPTTNESLKEDLEGVTVDTDSETIQITQKEDGGVSVETSPKGSDEPFMEEPMFEEPPMEGDEVPGDEEVIEPLTDEEEEEIAEENPESEEDEEEIEDIDSDSFDELGESYLKEAYENVKSFKTNKVYKKNDKLVVEGIVSFKSGKNKKTSFIFESAHNKSKKKVLLGENKQITPNSKSFRLRGAVKNKKMVCESLRYNYKEGKNRVSGICRVK